MSNQVNYLMSGPAHMPYLVVSLNELRKYFKGEVAVHVWEESKEIGLRIAKDLHLAVSVKSRRPEYRGKNDQFFDKIKLMQTPGSTYDVNLYIDADTMPVRKLDSLFEMAGDNGFCATQFNNWTTNNGIVRGRIERLRAFPSIPQELVDEALNPLFARRSFNGGVFAAHRDSKVLPQWYEWSMIAKEIFIADETVLHIMGLKFPKDFVSLYGYNISPKYQPKNLPDEHVGIWHFHGDSNVRPDKSQKGHSLWWPKFIDCLERNVGGMADWIETCGNKWIRKLLNNEINGN